MNKVARKAKVCSCRSRFKHNPRELAAFWLVVLLTAAFSARAVVSDTSIASRTAEVNGVKLHYLTAGHDTPLILLHGYAETSLMWKPIIPFWPSASL